MILTKLDTILVRHGIACIMFLVLVLSCLTFSRLDILKLSAKDIFKNFTKIKVFLVNIDILW